MYKPYMPTAEEIAERTRQVREDGFVNEEGQWRESWQRRLHRRPEYRQPPPVEIQEVAAEELGIPPNWSEWGY